MKYPENVVVMYERLRNLEGALEYLEKIDKEKPSKGLTDRIYGMTKAISELTAKIYEEADIYAAETGADRDGSYDPDRLMDELEEQLNG